jgi:hypothetical protein
MEMPLRLLLATIVVVALAADPYFAKEGHAQHGHAQHGYAQHGTRANTTSSAAAGRNAAGPNSAPNKPAASLDAEATVAPPVLPPRGATQQQIRIVNPTAKPAFPGNASHGQAGAISTAPVARNAIGQPMAQPKIIGAVLPSPPPLQTLGAVSPSISYPMSHPTSHAGGTATPPVVSSAAARVNVANAVNRGGVNGTTVIRPTTGSSSIGGATQPRYGINGTAVQNRR